MSTPSDDASVRLRMELLRARSARLAAHSDYSKAKAAADAAWERLEAATATEAAALSRVAEAFVAGQ